MTERRPFEGWTEDDFAAAAERARADAERQGLPFPCTDPVKADRAARIIRQAIADRQAAS